MRRFKLGSMLFGGAVLALAVGCAGTPVTPDSGVPQDGGTGPGPDGGGSDAGVDGGGSDAGVDGGGSDAGADGGGSDAGVDGGGGSDGGADGGSSDAGVDAGAPQPLTVKNYLNWCSVSVAGGTSSVAAAQTVDVMPGTIDLSATAANATFILGLWHHTSGDTGSGDPGTVSGSTSTTSVVVGNAPMCVWVCCPFTNGTGCAVPEQCP